MKKYIAALGILVSLSSHAQIVIKDAAINVDSRGDVLTASDVQRLQEKIRIGFTIDAGGIVEIVGLASTGATYNDWIAVKSSNGQTGNLDLAFRNIYLRKTMGKITAEAGALTPVATVGSAGLPSAGWIDGIRVKANTQIGNFKVTAGSLGSFAVPNAFARTFDANFVEIEMEKKVFEKILTQTAVESFKGDLYVREDMQVELKVFGDKVFKLFADALYDVERNAYNYDLGLDIDVLKNIVQKYEGRVDLKLYFSSVNANIPTQSDQISAFYTYGPRFTAQIGGKLDKAGNVNWYTRAVLGPAKANRFDVGVNIKIPVKKNR